MDILKTESAYYPLPTPDAFGEEVAMTQTVFRRYEAKYHLTNRQRSRLKILMASHMRPDAHGPSTVRSLYYDTPTHLLARRSSERPAYKEKLRIRSYREACDTTLVFLELKKKFDGVVYKRRVTLPLAAADAVLRGSKIPTSQIEREIAFTASMYEDLQPAMLIICDREAYYDMANQNFRITLDRRVRCRWEEATLKGSCEGRSLLDETTSLMELKCAGALPLWMVGFLASEHIHRVSFSKYCSAWLLQQAIERPIIWEPDKVTSFAQVPLRSGAGPPAKSHGEHHPEHHSTATAHSWASLTKGASRCSTHCSPAQPPRPPSPTQPFSSRS